MKMRKPKQFAKPSIRSGLAAAMTPPLSVIIKSSVADTIAACTGSLEEQSKVCADNTTAYVRSLNYASANYPQ